ncbi:MAG: hypothetical protein M1421_03200 [Candidatus Eremiobacteraeota bacterium]|jgi:hypothetical protein|nr:hypothetical protein [Candidatus Eremiobacteraeota bacterium]MCL5056180.1 hypothetical protein [Bacillota bacterium]
MSLKEAVVLQYKMAKNEEYIYEITVDSSREARSGSESQRDRDLLKMQMTQKVLGVNGDGSYNLEMLVESKQLMKNDQVIQIDPAQAKPVKVQMKMSKNGEILETTLQSPASQPSFPTRPVFIGETWNGESQVSLQDPTTGQNLPPYTLKFNYNLASIDKVKGYECARIAVSNPETEIPLSQGISQKVICSGATYFAHKEGRLVKSDVETQIIMSHPEGTLYNTIKITVDLAKAHSPLSSGDEFLISG